MSTSQLLKRELPILAILIAPIIYLMVVWDKIPAQLPIHWNIRGEVDDYGPKYLLPLINVGLYLFMLLIPRIDPRKKNYALFSTTYFKLRLILVIFFSTIISVIISKGIGFNIDQDRIILIGVILLLTILGNYMGTLKPNWFVGIRVPWTLDNETVWRKTHYMAGRLWFWMGVVLLILAFFLPLEKLNAVLFAAVMIMAITPIVYSYIIFQKEKTQNHA